MAEWLYEAGIGESRAALVEHGRILVAIVEPDDGAAGIGGVRVGAVVGARLVERLPGGRAVVALDEGGEALLPAVPPRLSQGARLTVEIIREALPEPGRVKRAKAIVSDAVPRPAPTLIDRIDADAPVRTLAAHDANLLEDAGWSEVLDEATSGKIVFSGGALHLSPTPAMTLFDVDGEGALDTLAVAAAIGVAQAIVRHGIGGSIGVDFPTIVGKAPRQAVAAAIDAHLPQPFERTAVNGFGFLQIVRPRARASLPEILRADPVGAAARAALRVLERVPPSAPNRHRLPATVAERIESRADWLDELVRRTGRIPIFDR